jgi:hypothetical protein
MQLDHAVQDRPLVPVPHSLRPSKGNRGVAVVGAQDLPHDGANGIRVAAHARSAQHLDKVLQKNIAEGRMDRVL